MTDFQKTLLELNENLAILREREAGYAGNVPPDLLNQIRDHRTAIELAKQASANQISEAEWREQIQPLLVSLNREQVIINIDAPTIITFNQQNQQVDTQYNVAGDLHLHTEEAPPPDPATLAKAERRFRAKLTAAFAEDAAAYVNLAGETTELVAGQPRPKLSPRAARRLRQRAEAEYAKWVQQGQEIKRIKLNTLHEAVEQYDRVILLGAPGSGKTTALEKLAHQFAGGRRSKQNRTCDCQVRQSGKRQRGALRLAQARQRKAGSIHGAMILTRLV